MAHAPTAGDTGSLILRALRVLAAGTLAAGAVLLALGGPVDGGGRESADARSAATGSAVFARMGCGGCHRLADGGGAGEIGPALDTLLPNYDAATLRAKIVDPYPAGEPADFSAMPQDFGRRMSAAELD
ncbi:MAG TPA: c-type cytochrome, partial [Solirubrobacteraceae bacterium]|nr:c-type cytochrome [Solirubrobacteraceae bacterium]